MDSILFVVAHPDDLAWGMGGTASLLKDRYSLHVVCATKGECGLPERTPAETAAMREKEEAAACELLGAKLTFLGKVDREVFADGDVCRKVAEIIRATRPVAVFAMWPVDVHADHSAASDIARKAVFIAGGGVELVYFEIFTTRHFAPEVHVNISNVMDKKLEIVRCHESQNRNDALVQLTLERSAQRGRESGSAHAEGFRRLLLPAGFDCVSVLEAIALSH